MLFSKKLFLSIMLLSVLFSFSLIGSVGASSEMWSKTYGGGSGDSAQSLVETSDGGYALAGRTKSFGAGSYDFWLIKTDAYGIPEFPSWAPLLIMLIAVVAVALIYRRSLYKPNQGRRNQ